MRVYKCLIALLALTLVLTNVLPCHAAEWPTKPITLVVPWGAGGNADLMARILAKTAEPHLGQPIIVVNKPGGGTIPGVMDALMAPPDGYTLVWIAAPSVATQPHLQKTPYSMADLYPIATVTENYTVLYVREDSPWYTLKDFIEAAKAKPLGMSLNGIGGLPHLAAVDLAQKSGGKFKFIAAESSGAAVLQLLGGHVDCSMAHEPQAFSHGKGIRALAVFEKERTRRLPLVPTADEFGYPIFGYTRDGVAVTAKAPADVKKKLEEVFAKATANPAFEVDLAQRGIQKSYLNHADTQKMWNEASDYYKNIIESMKK